MELFYVEMQLHPALEAPIGSDAPPAELLSLSVVGQKRPRAFVGPMPSRAVGVQSPLPKVPKRKLHHSYATAYVEPID